MLLGCTVKSLEDVTLAHGLDVDYLELKGDALCVDDASLDALRRAVDATGLPVRALTSPLPRRYGCRFVGPQADPRDALEVFTTVTDLAAGFGVEVVVLGSGQARSVPAGFDRDEAMAQFRGFALDAADVCARRGVTLTLEPLAGVETNMLNSCGQAAALLADLPGAGVGITIDCFHVFSEGHTPAAEVAAAAGQIAHAHTSSLPRGSMDFREDIQREFLASLRATGYAGGLTIEEDFSDFGLQAPAAVGVFRRLLDDEAMAS